MKKPELLISQPQADIKATEYGKLTIDGSNGGKGKSLIICNDKQAAFFSSPILGTDEYMTLGGIKITSSVPMTTMLQNIEIRLFRDEDMAMFDNYSPTLISKIKKIWQYTKYIFIK